ncbi:MAG: hypothetical protein AMXMBFR34_16340 [Myxococcaceae bacterium]
MSSPDAAVSAAEAPKSLAGRFKAFKEKNHIAFEVTFFFAGFLFDVVLLHRIDSTPLLIHQGIYLVLSSALIFWDHRIHVAGKEPEGRVLGKLAGIRLWVMHFFLGTLLNAFMVFYFRASSGILSFVFLVILAGIIVGNELPQFRSKGPIVRVMLLSFAVTSFLAYLIPVLWGSLGIWQYPLAVVVGSAATYGLWRLFTRFTRDPSWTFKRAVAPGLGMQATLLLMYVVNVIPPVPLSLKHIAIYASVTSERTDKGIHYTLEYQKAPVWKFWRTQDTTFRAPAGSKAYAFVKIFAPTRFHDQVRFAWEYDDPKNGWTARGNPHATGLSGGNEEGYRTFAYSTMGKPGTYRVRVLTADGREIGRKTFTFEEGEQPALFQEVD